MNKSLKRLLITFLLIFSLFVCSPVFADNNENTNSLDNSSEVSKNVKTDSNTDNLDVNNLVKSNSGKYTCEQLLGSKDTKGTVMHLLSDIYGIMRIAAVILVIVLGMLDFTSAVAASDSDKLNKAGKIFTKRLIILLVFFLIPNLVNLIITIAFGPSYICGF